MARKVKEFTNEHGETIKVGDVVGFKYDYEGSGYVLEILQERDRLMGFTRTTVIIGPKSPSFEPWHYGYSHQRTIEGWGTGLVMGIEGDRVWVY